MGRVRNKRMRATKNKKYSKRHCTARRKKDIDQIQDELAKAERTGEAISFEADEDLPGMGQFYCAPCARHFMSQTDLDNHVATKIHKRRLKDVAQEQYSQREADLAAGKTIEVLPPAHPDLVRTRHESIDGSMER